MATDKCECISALTLLKLVFSLQIIYSYSISCFAQLKQSKLYIFVTECGIEVDKCQIQLKKKEEIYLVLKK